MTLLSTPWSRILSLQGLAAGDSTAASPQMRNYGSATGSGAVDRGLSEVGRGEKGRREAKSARK